MNFKTTIILACIAIGVCAGYVLWRGRTPQPADSTAAPPARLLSLVDDTEIERIEYTRGHAAPMVFVRDGERWNLAAPQACRATAWMVNELIIALKGLDVAAAHDLGASGSPTLEQAGILPQPVARLVLTTTTGIRFEILIGKPLLSSSTTYAYCPADAGRLAVVARDFTEILERTPMQYRDHRLFDFAAESAVGITVVRHDDGQETRCTLERRAHGWWFTAPFEARAQDNRIDSMISGAERLWVSEWVDESDNDLAHYGLAPPALEVHITCDNAGTPTTSSLLISRQNPLTDPAQVYVARDGQAGVGLIGTRDAAQFEPRLDDWRDLDLITQPLADVSALIITNDHGVVKLTRQNDAWFVSTADEPAHREMIERRIKELEELTAVSFIAPVTGAALEQIVATVTLEFDHGAPLVLSIGPFSDSSARRLRLVQVSGRTATAKVRVDDVMWALQPLNVFYDPYVVHDTPQRLQRLEVHRRITSPPARQFFVLERTRLGLWSMTHPPLGHVRQDRAQTLAATLAALQGRRVLEPAAQLRAVWPDPDARISLTFEAPPVVGDRVSTATPTATTIALELYHTDEHTWARRSDRERIHEISRTTYDTLLSEVMPERLWNIDPIAVQRASWGTSDNMITLERDGSLWRSSADTDLPLDQEKVNAHITRLCNLSTSRYVVYADANLADYSLDSPTHTLELRMRDGHAHTLRLTEHPVEDVGYCATPDDGSRVCVVGADAVELCSEALSSLE